MSDKTLVVGVDFSDANRPALEAAIHAARDARAGLTLVHALTPLGAPGLEPAQPDVHAWNNESADVLGSDFARARQWEQRVRDAGIPVESVSRAGQPARVLIAEAKRVGADAIVVGTHGRTGLAKMFLGSVASDVVDRTTIPVLIVPEKSTDMQHVVFPRSES